MIKEEYTQQARAEDCELLRQTFCKFVEGTIVHGNPDISLETKAGGFGAERKAQKAQDAADQYFETYRQKITLCQAAERHLKDTLNGRDKIPLPAWKAERDKLNAERKQLDVEYKKLKADIATVEKIRSNVYDVVSAERRRIEQQRAKGMER